MYSYSLIKAKYYNWFKNSSIVWGVFFLVTVLFWTNYFQRKQLAGIAVIKYLLFFFIGWLLWTISEYLIHRFAFHFKSKKKVLKLVQFLLHGVHHSHPHNTLIIPLFFRAGILIKSYLLFSVLPAIIFAPVYSGYLSGMLSYLFIHWAIHKGYCKKLLSIQYKLHYWHHYKNQHSAYGVTLPLWDYFFGTLPPDDYSSRGSVH